MRCCATCRGHRSLHWHRSRFPANGAALVVGGVCRSWGWPDGRAAQGSLQVRPCKLGRRLLVRAVLHARQGQGWASCPTRPRHASGPCGSRPCAAPPPPATDSFRARPPRNKKEKIKSGSGSLRSASTHGVDLPCRPRSTPTNSRRETVGGGAVWGCRTVGAMDGAIEPPGTGLRRVLQPHTAPPNPQQPRAALALASAGAGLQALQYNYVTQPAITSRARIASHSSSIRHTRLIASRRSGSRCHTGNSPASV